MLEECGRRTADNDDACLYHNLTHEPKGSDEIINGAQFLGQSQFIIVVFATILFLGIGFGTS